MLRVRTALHGPQVRGASAAALSPGSLSAKRSQRCARCGRLVTGTTLQALGKDRHPACSVSAAGGEPLHWRALKVRDGRAECERHNQKRFDLRCAVGGGLIREVPYLEKDGKAYCERHYHECFGERCAIEGQLLQGEYIDSGWGRPLSRGARGLAECSISGCPICQSLTVGRLRYRDGGSMCNRCQQTAVDDRVAGHPIREEVQGALVRLDLETGSVEIPLCLADQKE